MTRRVLTAVAFIWLPLAAAASLDVNQQTYTCERGVQVPVVYLTEMSDDPDAGAVAVLLLDGRQLTLWRETAASGARYGFPSDGSHYVWWTKDDSATLFWRDGADGSETVVLRDCAANG